VARQKKRPGVRRTQAERSASTQLHILETTFGALAELGYSGTTTVKICQRGKISRGALLHHYSTKTALVAATVEYVLERRLQAFRAGYAALPEGVDPRAAALDLLWEQFSGPVFYVWLELLVAARTDDELRDTIARVGHQFSARARALNAELFPGVGDTQMGRLMLKFTFAMLQGLAVDRIIPDDTPIEVMLDVLKRLGNALRGGGLGGA
jgi:AcrR family transcriptional regulator